MQTLEKAISQLRAGGMIILIDDECRENEGDLVVAAEFATPQCINFMLTHARGVVCLSMTKSRAACLNLKRLSTRNNNDNVAQFAMSFDAAKGVTTGVSAHERSHSIQIAIDDKTKPVDLATPGHVFPLIAEDHGVFMRGGHTEGSIDLMKIARLRSAAVICEILNQDGTMARGNDIQKFSQRHRLPIVSIAQILQYRQQHEGYISSCGKAKLPTKHYGDLYIESFVNLIDKTECITLYPQTFFARSDVLTRIHSSCLTGDVLQSLRCDCGLQLRESLQRIVKQNGVLIYLQQEGRGIGLSSKIKAYALQEQGLDTVEANLLLGFPSDQRDFSIAAQVLKVLKIPSIHLMTNNPEKVKQLRAHGIQVNKRIPLLVEKTSDNEKYLRTKQQKLGHLLNII